ncbi:hypothetical protein C8R44DRAFT_726043 [Mycena epipterygia]|nr:hypothetical protein C8R44DRAFT_726043 [Mycena epipterygia]
MSKTVPMSKTLRFDSSHVPCPAHARESRTLRPHPSPAPTHARASRTVRAHSSPQVATHPLDTRPEVVRIISQTLLSFTLLRPLPLRQRHLRRRMLDGPSRVNVGHRGSGNAGGAVAHTCGTYAYMRRCGGLLCVSKTGGNRRFVSYCARALVVDVKCGTARRGTGMWGRRRCVESSLHQTRRAKSAAPKKIYRNSDSKKKSERKSGGGEEPARRPSNSRALQGRITDSRVLGLAFVFVRD